MCSRPFRPLGFTHLCRSRPRGSVHSLLPSSLRPVRLGPFHETQVRFAPHPIRSIDSFTPVHSALQLAHLSRSTPVGSIETRSTPVFSRCYPRSFAFYVARPALSIHHVLLCRSTRRVMSSCARNVSRRRCQVDRLLRRRWEGQIAEGAHNQAAKPIPVANALRTTRSTSYSHSCIRSALR
jgi:hypothetical protein